MENPRLVPRLIRIVPALLCILLLSLAPVSGCEQDRAEIGSPEATHQEAGVPMPEPPTLLLGAVGVLFFHLRRRRWGK